LRNQLKAILKGGAAAMNTAQLLACFDRGWVPKIKGFAAARPFGFFFDSDTLCLEVLPPSVQ
jgi:hypothetical protein